MVQLARNLTIRLAKQSDQKASTAPTPEPSASEAPVVATTRVETKTSADGADGRLASAFGAGVPVDVTAVNLLGKKGSRRRGEKVHFCKQCDFPVVVYGRLVPCLHAFCYTCAEEMNKTCARCNTVVDKVEAFDYRKGFFICNVCYTSFPTFQEFDAHRYQKHLKMLPLTSAPAPLKQPPQPPPQPLGYQTPPKTSQPLRVPPTPVQMQPPQPPGPPPPAARADPLPAPQTNASPQPPQSSPRQGPYFYPPMPPGPPPMYGQSQGQALQRSDSQSSQDPCHAQHGMPQQPPSSYGQANRGPLPPQGQLAGPSQYDMQSFGYTQGVHPPPYPPWGASGTPPEPWRTS